MRPTTIFLAFMIGALAFLFFIGKQSGVKAPELPTLAIPDAVKEMAKDENGRPLIDTGVYKWQDSNGRWHYGDKPPADAQIQMVDVNPNRNIIAGAPQKEKEEQVQNGDLPPMEQMPGMAGAAFQMQKLLQMVPQTQQQPSHK